MPSTMHLTCKTSVSQNYLVFVAGRATYDKLESRFAFFISISIKCYAFNTFTLFSASALVPVAYLLFGFPQPEQWKPLIGYP